MKSIIALLFVVLALQGWAQTTEPNSLNDKEFLLTKSKNQKTGGFVLIGVGVAVTAGGTSMLSSSAKNGSGTLWNYGIDDGSFFGAGAFMLLGVTCLATGASLLVSAAKNKKKARATTAFLKTEQRPFVHQGSFMRSPFPAIGIKINL